MRCQKCFFKQDDKLCPSTVDPRGSKVDNLQLWRNPKSPVISFGMCVCVCVCVCVEQAGIGERKRKAGLTEYYACFS